MLEKYKISLGYSVKQAIQKMEDEGVPVVFIVNDVGVLEGIFTSGDMRKFILENGNFSAPIQEAMNPQPVVFRSAEEAAKAKSIRRMLVYPVVDDGNVLTDALFERPASLYGSRAVINNVLADVPLVIMAGGKGTRLYPYTKVLPKALIPIGDLTITERIINKFCQYGCKEVYLILNHKANMVKSYFNEIETPYKLHYIEENQFLGTGGGLRLLQGIIHKTFILSNCDVLINDDLDCIYKTHIMKGNQITFVCAAKSISIPYGIVETDVTGSIVKMKEKPEISFLTNTGVYVVEPEVLEQIRLSEYIDFPNVAERCMEAGKRVGVFPVAERAWLDMGQVDEMDKMTKYFERWGEAD